MIDTQTEMTTADSETDRKLMEDQLSEFLDGLESLAKEEAENKKCLDIMDAYCKRYGMTREECYKMEDEMGF